MACADYFQPYIHWLQQNDLPPGTVTTQSNIVKVIGVANRPGQGCYYLDGVFRNYAGSQFTGWGTQYFNDRAPGNNPFNPQATDKVGLTLTLPNGPLIMVLQSWGNALMQYTLECKDNLLFGYCGDIAIIMSLKEGTLGF
jgi:hypothetical protein